MSAEPGIARSLCVSAEAAAGTPPPGAARITVEDGIATLLLDRPPRNVLDIRTMHELIEALAGLGRETALRALVLRSSLPVFSSGVDVKEHRGELVRPMLSVFHRLLGALLSFEAPTLAVIEGTALGGGLELALACDLRVVAAEARLGLPEITLGVFPPFAAVRLPEICGLGRAAQLALTGETISGERAYAIGLADVVAPRAEIEAALAPIVASLRGKSAAALRLAKEALHLASPASRARLAEVESLYLGKLMATEDADEGLAAFLEKRPPIWKHR